MGVRNKFGRLCHMKAKLRILLRRAKNVLKYGKQVREGRKKIKSLFQNSLKDAVGRELDEKEKRIWEDSLLYYNRYVPLEASILAAALISDCVCLKKECGWNEVACDDPILLCNVKDDLRRMQMSVEYHRKLGISHFAVLDNGSTDGTLEWLLQQPDVEVYTVQEKYNSKVRAGWILKVALCYGMDRWYLIVDSDELLVYDGEQTIQQFIGILEKSHITRSLGLMIDMYAQESDLLGSSDDEIYSRYKYYDQDSYRMVMGEFAPLIAGGPRNRYFGIPENGVCECLTKFPLFYWRKGEIYAYHYACPFEDNFKADICVGLLHYKFLDGDMEKYRRITMDGNYAGGSFLYKHYLDEVNETGKISFMDKNSRQLGDQDMIEKIRRGI